MFVTAFLCSYVLLSYLLLLPAWCLIRFLVLARDDGIVGTYSVLWVFTCFRQKNTRTKVSLNVRMSVQASLTYLCHFNVCTFGAWLSAILLYKNIRFFLLFLLRILCLALQFFCHDVHSDVLAEACFCTNRRMGIIRILMFFCSYVLTLLSTKNRK